METGNTNFGQSVTAVVIKDNKVLLARHTYGGGKGLLIVPELTKKLIESALRGGVGLHKEEYNGSTRNGPYSLYCL